METILLVIAVAVMCIVSFITGAKVGQKVVKGEPVEMPNLNPVKAINNAIEEHKEKKEKEAEDQYYEAILHNIDVYDGTSAGQKQIPIRK